jgi:hypothetical protein
MGMGLRAVVGRAGSNAQLVEPNLHEIQWKFPHKREKRKKN